MTHSRPMQDHCLEIKDYIQAYSMATYATYRVNEKKCATCTYSTGERKLVVQAYKPTFVNVTAGHSSCMVNQSRLVRGVDRCPAWQVWEKIR